MTPRAVTFLATAAASSHLRRFWIICLCRLHVSSLGRQVKCRWPANVPYWSCVMDCMLSFRLIDYHPSLQGRLRGVGIGARRKLFPTFVNVNNDCVC
jgi:hypothetical protein